MTYKVHLDGYNLVPYLTGQAAKSPRESFFYINDDQQVVGLRYDNWKLVFMEQRVNGTLEIWANPFTELRVPKIFNLRTDPYERCIHHRQRYGGVHLARWWTDAVLRGQGHRL